MTQSWVRSITEHMRAEWEKAKGLLVAYETKILFIVLNIFHFSTTGR